MPPIKRRQFLQFAGSALASIGLSQVDFLRQGNQVARVLAQPTSRKLALLVGINAYGSQETGWSALQGCVTDVQMQEALLVHRFGFNPNDILTLTDEAATREGILTAFREHLIKQAQPGDVVVFHFSGHGSRIIDPQPYQDESPLNSTLVPIDAPLPQGGAQSGAEVNDIMGRHLFLLMSALKTEHVTVVLDSCHSGGGKRGALTIRARSGATSVDDNLYPNGLELEEQKQLQTELGWSDDDFYNRRRQNVAKGVVIASAAAEQYAADASFPGFHAGVFTCMMTQYLWQVAGNEPMGSAIANIGRSTTSLARYYTGVTAQIPEFETNLPPELAGSPLYFLPKQSPPADAIVTRMEGDRVQLWLGGIHPQNMTALNEAVFTALDRGGQPVGDIHVTNRNGLIAEGTIMTTNRGPSMTAGMFLQESIRGIPQNLTLRVAVDPALREAAAARQALAQIPRITMSSVEDGEVDYIFGRLTAEYRAQQTGLVEVPPAGCLGLFLPGLDVLPGSFGGTDEPVAGAIARLTPKFSTLLATRLLRLLGNTGSSRLNVVASLQPVGSNATAIADSITVRGFRDENQATFNQTGPDLSAIPADASRLPVGTVVELTVTNNEPRDLYISILVVTPEGEILPIFPTNWDDPVAAALVEARTTLRVPDQARGDNFRLRLVPPVGMVEVLVLASASPLQDTLQALGQMAIRQGGTRGTPVIGDEQMLAITETLANDLNNGTRGTRSFQTEFLSPQVRGIASDQLAAFSITFELYEPS